MIKARVGHAAGCFELHRGREDPAQGHSVKVPMRSENQPLLAGSYRSKPSA